MRPWQRGWHAARPTHRRTRAHASAQDPIIPPLTTQPLHLTHNAKHTASRTTPCRRRAPAAAHTSGGTANELMDADEYFDEMAVHS